MNISRAQQRVGHISSVQVPRKSFGMTEVLEDVVTVRRLKWLGHVARMEDERTPKRLLFGGLPQHRPAQDEVDRQSELRLMKLAGSKLCRREGPGEYWSGKGC